MATYTVKAGDTLSKIARDELGEMARWREIEALNPGLTQGIGGPLIFPGQVLQMPELSRFRVADTAPAPGAQIMPRVPTKAELQASGRGEFGGVQINWPLLLAMLAIGGGLLWFGLRK